LVYSTDDLYFLEVNIFLDNPKTAKIYPCVFGATVRSTRR